MRIQKGLDADPKGLDAEPKGLDADPKGLDADPKRLYRYGSRPDEWGIMILLCSLPNIVSFLSRVYPTCQDNKISVRTCKRFF